MAIVKILCSFIHSFIHSFFQHFKETSLVPVWYPVGKIESEGVSFC